MLSIVVPTHNRSASAVRLALALDRQECSRPVEATFVLDGCTDDTRHALESLELRRPLNIIDACGAGAAAARNRGAAASSGDVLLFLDDDVVPQAGLFGAHLRAHRYREHAVVVGPYPYGPDMPVNPLDFRIRDWWQGRFAEMARRKHVFTYEDCVTGNLSLPRADFESVGGFDEHFEKDGREDYELGVRLLKSGMSMSFAVDALAYHYPTNRPSSSLRKWYTFGRADVRMAAKHPYLFDSLLFSRWATLNPAFCTRSRAALSLCGSHGRSIASLGWFFDRNMARLWKPRFWQVWEWSKSLVYFAGAVSASGGMSGFIRFSGESMRSCPAPTSNRSST